MTDTVKANPAEQSIRLFRNDLLEALTHVHPIVPLLFWTPVAGWLLWRAVAVQGIGALALALCALAGLLVWSISEYLLHRFVFHFPATSRVGKWLVFMFHGVHHDAPRDKTRLVMPPAGAVIIMSVLWILFGMVVPAPWLEPFVAFFILSYLCYDYIHYATHHFPMRHPVLHFLKVYHLQHHYGAKGLRYGVSSPLWDHVFGTYPTPAQTRSGD
jgi:sterol desaturase/sphingolipid hydroxylase (fatty acid hydroxylase superfamily)